MPEVLCWMFDDETKPVTEMTRDELIEVVESMAKELGRYQTGRARTAMAFGEVEMLKRGLDA